MKARIERQIEQRTLIFSGVSHDLRTPLTRLKLGLSMQDDSAENQDLIQDVNEMERLINEFLDFSKYGSIDETELVDPLEIINGIIENSNRNGDKLTFGETLKEKTLIPLKPLSIKRAIENIVNNAEKWSSLVVVICSFNQKIFNI